MIDFHGMRLQRSATAEALVATDWSDTSLGEPGGWPAALRTAIQLCLNSRFPMTLIWGDGLLTVYNDAFIPIMGDKHPAGFGQPAAGVYPELVAELWSPLRAVLEDGEAVFESDRCLPLEREGRLREAYFTFSYSPLRDESGMSRGVLALAAETTEQMLQQRRSRTLSWLAEELSKQSALEAISSAVQAALQSNRADFAATALLEVDVNGTCTVEWCEPAAAGAALLEAAAARDLAAGLRLGSNRSSVQAIGDRRFALTLVDDDSLNGFAYVLLLEPGELVSLDAAYHTLLRVMQETLIGAVYRIAAERQALDDVTRRLGERDRLYRLLFEHSQDGILICSPDGDITAANPAACELLGFTEQDLRDMGRAGLVMDDEADLQRCMAERARRGAFMGELTFRRKHGAPVKVDISSSAFMDDASGEARAITVFRDAAPRLVTQERIAATARLEAVGALTGGIAHDFNNLLNVIINGAEDLVDRLPGDSDERESADMVLTASARAADLTRQLLAFSRQQPMAPCCVDIGAVVRELDQMLSRTMGGGIDVCLHVASGDHALTDRALLQSAILNLCINARDAMPDGGTLSVSSGAVEVDEALGTEIGLAAGEYVRIRVADTGVGISPEHMGRILEPFFTTKPVGRGTGLGLSMVFGFARQSGGSVDVQSLPGRGTRVDLYLPLSAAAEEVLEEDPAVAGEVSGERDPASHRLLVVEDEQLLATMLRRILEDAGYQVSVCRDGEAALGLLEQESEFALVLTDILLGRGMNGWTLTRRIESRWPALPVLTMSGHAPSSPGQTVERAPNLHKPFRPREVLALLDDVLNGGPKPGYP